MEKMNILLEGHEKLLAGLKEFLCSYYHVQTGARYSNPLSAVDFENFINKLRVRLSKTSKI
jgi:hypothetical protein